MQRNVSKTAIDQSQRFIKAARAVDVDEDEATFKTKLAVIARQKPKDEASASKTTDKKGKKNMSKIISRSRPQ